MASAQSPRAVLRLKWTADSIWEGTHLQKPHRFHVHEELEGRLVLDVPDTSFLPRVGGVVAAGSQTPVRAIQLRDDGIASNATLIEAAGSTSYRSDVLKEGGDCATLADSLGTSGPPFAGQETGTNAWDGRAPGTMLIVLRGSTPIEVAFAPKAIVVEGAYRLMCEKPETVRKFQRYRATARIARANPRAEGQGDWTMETTPDADRGGYTITARYRASATQIRPVAHDPTAATGRLEVTKTFVISWRAADR
jgi:hypothetical protein